MDTATHIAIGVGLTALATQDPAMASTFGATATTLIVGSLIPDGDTVLKLKDNATYISHHRGITHSIPFTILWPILITFLIFTFFSGTNPFHVWMWAQLAVFLHVFVDIFNSYGTQALRPITNKWIQLSVINTFDPIIFHSSLYWYCIMGYRLASICSLLSYNRFTNHLLHDSF